jgi:hypothetical protein
MILVRHKMLSKSRQWDKENGTGSILFHNLLQNEPTTAGYQTQARGSGREEVERTIVPHTRHLIATPERWRT